MAGTTNCVLQPIAKLARICHERRAFHTDGVQAVGKIPMDVNKMNIDLMSSQRTRFTGPRASARCNVRRKNPRVQVSALIDGGGHERGMRSGTLNRSGHRRPRQSLRDLHE